MAIELKLPALSPTMEKGTLARWLVATGDAVAPGDLLAEIETDKATMELEATEKGRIASLLVPGGTDDVAVGTVIALLAEAEESVPHAAVAGGSVPVTGGPIDEASPAAGVVTLRSRADTPESRRRLSPAERTKVSPLAARLAEAKGIALDDIVGSGPGGRIVRADLGLRRSAPVTGATMPAAAPPAFAVVPPPSGVPVETAKLSAMRRTIARRLTEAKQTVPHFYLTARCNLDPLLGLRRELNGALATRGVKLSVNDLLLKALALALVAVPDANVQFGGDQLHRFSRVDIAMAVSIEGGLVTPVIRDVAGLSLSALAEVTKAVAIKARAGKLAPENHQGGTASLSNLGMYGIEEMVPVINPPQALILGVGAGVERPWKVGADIALATVVAATASFDHRAIDGAVAAQFMKALRELVETPLLIVG